MLWLRVVLTRDGLDKVLSFLKVKNQVKQLNNNLNENFYGTEECLKILKSIDKSYTDRLNNARVAEVLVEFNYPGLFIILIFILLSFHVT